MLMRQPQGTRNKSVYTACSGFTLIEMAVVLLILGTLLGGLLNAISQVSLNSRRAEARSQLERVEDALYGYAQAYGRLPCPATGVSIGAESRTVAVDPDSDCSELHGFVPNSTLNLNGQINQDSLLLDPWGNPYRYSVSANGAQTFTSSAALNNVFTAGIITPANMLSVCNTAVCAPADVISDLVPAIVFSMGADWATTTTADELENAGEGGSTLTGANGAIPEVYNVGNDILFVDSGYVEDQYDDILLWLSPYVLFNRLIEAGRLP